MAHVQAPVPPIRDHRSEVPEAVAGVIERMLAKSPDERFSTPAEVAEALAPFERIESDFFKDFFFHFVDQRIDFGCVDFALFGRTVQVDVSFVAFVKALL